MNRAFQRVKSIKVSSISHLMKMKFLVLSSILYFLHASEAKNFSDITRIGYGGPFAMFRVPRKSVEKKVEEFNSIYRCDDSKLRLLVSYFVCFWTCINFEETYVSSIQSCRSKVKRILV